MKLAAWMQQNDHTDVSLAALVRRDRTSVLRWRTDKTRPDMEALAELESLTGHAVTASDFKRAEGASQ